MEWELKWEVKGKKRKGLDVIEMKEVNSRFKYQISRFEGLLGIKPLKARYL